MIGASLLSVAAVTSVVSHADDLSGTESTAAPEASKTFQLPPYFVDAPAPVQPIVFSHAKHAGTLNLPCETCHRATEDTLQTAAAGHPSFADVALPQTSVCMTCHANVAVDRPGIKTLARYYEAGDAVPWEKVYSVLTGVNWSHRPHLSAKVSCETCHGAVPELEVMSVQTSVTAMGSCIGCHQANGASRDCETCHSWPTAETFTDNRSTN